MFYDIDLNIMADVESVLSATTPDHIDDLLADKTDEELAELVENTMGVNDVLKHETEIFERYLKRVEPKELAANFQTAPALPQAENLVRGRRRIRSRGGAVDKLLQLTPEQKYDIAQHEIDVLRNEMKKMNEDAEKVLDGYKASLEELELWFAETKKGLYEFDRDVCKGAVNSRTGEIVAEKVVRFFEDKLRSRDTLIEKLRLKNSTMRVLKKKLILQLKQKEEMGEVLHEVDFNQLKIENHQYLEKIDEKNQELLRLKLMAGNTLQVLNKYKEKLNLLTLDAVQLKSDIASKQEILKKFNLEIQTVEEERNNAEKKNMKLRQRLSDFKVPNVQNYVEIKSNLIDLKKIVKSWERKVEVANMTLTSQKQKWNRILKFRYNDQSWAA